MEHWIIWFAVGAALAVADILLQIVWGYCFAVGCAGAMVAAFTGADFLTQVLVMGIVSVVAFLLLFPLLRKWHALKNVASAAESRTGMDSLVGRRARLTQKVTPETPGRVKIDGDSWQVAVPGLEGEVPAGTTVTITGYDSIVLTGKV